MPKVSHFVLSVAGFPVSDFSVSCLSESSVGAAADGVAVDTGDAAGEAVACPFFSAETASVPVSFFIFFFAFFF